MSTQVEYVFFETHLIEFDTYAPADFMYHPPELCIGSGPFSSY